LLSTNKPPKNQKSPTKSLEVTVSKAINSQALSKQRWGPAVRGRQTLLLRPRTREQAACRAPLRRAARVAPQQGPQPTPQHPQPGETRAKQAQVDGNSFWKADKTLRLRY